MWVWLRRPRSVKFWFLAGGAVIAIYLEVNEIWNVVDWWGVNTKACSGEPMCVALRPPFSRSVLAFALIAVLFGLAAVLVWRASRAYRNGRRRL